MLDLDGDAGEGVAGVTPFLDAEGTIGGVGKSHDSSLVVLHIGVLSGLLREQVIPGRNLLGHGIVALQGQGDGHGPVRAGGVGADFLSFRVIHREHGPLQGDLGALLQLHDFQGRLARFFLLTVRIAADGGQLHLAVIVQVADIILQIAVLVFFQADGIHSGILSHGSVQGELDISALSLDTVCWVKPLELPGIAVPGAAGRDSGDLLVVHVHDLHALRHGAGVREGHGHIVVIYPGLAPDSKYLLLILLAVNGHGVGRGFVRRGGHAGSEHIVVGGAPLVDILGGGQDAVADVQLGAGEPRRNFEVSDIPIRHQVAPQRHFGGIIRLILIVQLQLSQAPMGVAIGDDAHHLGIAGLFLG